MAVFKLTRNSLQDRFLNSIAKVQIYGGGFANGKTAAICIKCIRIAKDYPGANILMARSTYPKLNDTLRKEFLKWCPPDWIKSFPKSANGSNTCTLTNGTTINFRYIAQQGKIGTESTTSNLLSATYDAIFVDQMEDPEIVYKDFLDLLGRLRGMTPYDGNDPSMPATGPRIFCMTTNPTRNWVYRKLVKPLHDLMEIDVETGKGKRIVINPDLLCETDDTGNFIVDEDTGLPKPMIELYEGSTYENQDNLEPDFIRTLEGAYRGQMRTRFLEGKWASYEGLVYPSFDESVHVVSHHAVEHYHKQLSMRSTAITYVEGYDYGLAVPFCYILGFCDEHGNVFLMDGAYQKEQPVDYHINGRHLGDEEDFDGIIDIRNNYGVSSDGMILADPDIFRRKAAGKKLVGKSVADMMLEDNIMCIRGNNEIANGIVKVSQYLIPQAMHRNPISGEYNAPYLYVSDKLFWWINEITDYYWKKSPTGDQIDMPVDKDDHAMDTTKYLLSNRPNVSKLIVVRDPKTVGWRQWGERDLQSTQRNVRHG
jgi:phage terminase large subunit